MPDVTIDPEEYQFLLSEIMAGKNLESHLAEVSAAIADMEKLLAVAKLRKEDTTAYERLKNDLYYLKYEILERL